MAEKKSIPPRRAPLAPPIAPIIRAGKPPPIRRNTVDVDMSWLEEIPQAAPEAPPSRRPSRRPSAPPKEAPAKRAAPPGLKGAGARHHTLEVRAEWLETEDAKRPSQRPKVTSRPPASRSVPPKAESKAKPPPLPPETRPKRAHPPPLPREEADDPPKRPSRRPGK